MRCDRVRLSAWTASFRYPNLISGYQPTLDVPPLSTVLGLLNAAAGRYIDHREVDIGYFFDFQAKGIDVETIYQIEGKDSKDGYAPSNEVKSNVIKREFLMNCRLYLYLTDPSLTEFFESPYYALTLGRSGDLLTVDQIDRGVVLEDAVHGVALRGQIIPIRQSLIPGEVQALPVYFSNTIPRETLGAEPFSIISAEAKVMVDKDDLCTYVDTVDDELVGIYFHHLTMNES